MKLPLIPIADYLYELPEERIAAYPCRERDQSKLLYYQNGKTSHHLFHELPGLIPDNSILFFNNTKVIPARILFQKSTGALIEVFLLDPVWPSASMEKALEARGKTVWHCTIGNQKRWPADVALEGRFQGIGIKAAWKDRESTFIEFSWDPPDKTFAEVIREAGKVPLPPYIRRAPEPNDQVRYQTIYSAIDGAIAAPTAGLHFTPRVMQEILSQKKGIDYLTLHVGAGTFLPVKEQDMARHTMHAEQVVITRKNVENLLSEKRIVAVGTTSMRTLESLYWYGALLLKDKQAPFSISSLLPYEMSGLPDRKTSMQAVLEHMQQSRNEEITGQTSIYILPGYPFRICDGLITNFHQPGSTLLLLIAAFIGSDWKKIYREALELDYRFLSYGDSSLLLKNN